MDYLKLAEENFDNDNYKKTIEYCDKLIAKGLYLKDAYCLKAHSECYISENKDDKILEDALKNINIAIENDNNDDWLFFIKAFVFQRMKKFEDALVAINKAIHLNKDYFYYDTRGILNKSLNREKEAIGDFTLSIEMKEDTDNYNNRGELYFDLEEYSLARADFQRAVELDNKNANAWEYLGETLNYLDLFELAISAFDTAIQLEPDYDFLYYLKSRSQKSLNNYKKALISINKAIEMNPEYSNYYRQRGKLYFEWIEENTNSENTDFEKAFSFYVNQQKSEKRVLLAEKDYKKAIELDDENILAYWYLFEVYQYRKDYKKQAEILEKLEKINSDNETVYSSRGFVEMNLGNLEKAILYFDKYIEYDRDCANAYGNRGICYKNLEKYEEALADFDKAIEISPCAKIYEHRGKIKRQLSGENAAIEEYKKALELEPDYFAAYWNIGTCKYSQKKFEESVENYLTAYEIRVKKGKDFSQESYIERFYDSLKGLFGEKKYKKTVNICNKIIKLGIKHEKIYNLKCAAKIMLKKYEEALKACNFALNLNPDFEPAKINLKIIKQKLEM